MDMEAALRQNSIEQLFDHLRRVVAIHIVMPATFILAVWSHTDRPTLIGWSICALLIVVWRYLLVLTFSRLAAGKQPGVAWAHHAASASFGTGLLWGSAVWLFLIPDSATHQAFLFTIILGHAAGSLIVTAYWLPAFYAYLVPALSLTILKLLVDGGIENQGLAALIVVYALILRSVAKAQHGAVQTSLQLRYENLDLVERLKTQKEAAENADKAKSMFLAAASHDLRQPMHALGLFASALNDKARDKEIRELSTQIGRSVEALTKLFDALLDISRLDAGTIKPQIQHFHLNNLIDQLTREFDPVARSRGLKWVTHIEPMTAHSDQALLELIIRNLVANALRYTDHGEVRLVARRDHGKITIAVSDTGRGIARENQDAIFREFFQLQNPERDRAKGLGLGLAIVRRLANLLKTEVRLESEPGKGSTFSLVVPEGQESLVESVQAAADVSRILQFHSGLVLVIDDELANLEATRLLLEDWGYEAVLAGSGAEARDALAELERKPDMIVADYRLRDGETGIDAVTAIRELLGEKIPAILVSGDTAPDRLREAKEQGFSLLHKPLQPARLRALLNNLIQHNKNATGSPATTTI